MICSNCETNYVTLENQWCYEQEGKYKVLCDVFTTMSLEQILLHAITHRITDIYIDTFQPTHPKCEECFLLHIREGAKRSELLEQAHYQLIEYHEFF